MRRETLNRKTGCLTFTAEFAKIRHFYLNFTVFARNGTKKGEKMSSFHFVYHGEDIGIKDYLFRLGFSSTFIKRVKYGGVTVNGHTVHMRASVHDGDSVKIEDVESANENVKPRTDIPIRVLYETDAFLAVFKPSGMPTHPSRGNHLPTLAEAVVGHYKDRPFTFRAVNRLDKDTSGIVIVAKNADAAHRLAESMKKGEFTKEYEALVQGVPSPMKGTVDAPIRRETENGMKRCVASDGKRAVTDYEVIEIKPDGNAVVHLVLHTGRTHQIRVHMAYIGHPLVADALYGTRKENETYHLCASGITVTDPYNREKIRIRCDKEKNV